MLAKRQRDTTPYPRPALLQSAGVTDNTASRKAPTPEAKDFFFRTFLRPHNVFHRRKLQGPEGAYGVLAKRQPARGAPYREVQHVTQAGARLAHQAAAARSRL